jgi:DNA replication licensing factor MCM4
MSSPTKRSTRSSATPRRSARNPESNQASGQGNSQLEVPESPIFYQSSSPGPSGQNDLPGYVSSPLRQETNSQSTRARSDIPSSPLRQMTDSQSDIDPQRTPRANPTTPAYHGGEKHKIKSDCYKTD